MFLQHNFKLYVTNLQNNHMATYCTEHKKVKISIISLRGWEIKELSESNIILQDCYNGHLPHFQYTSLSRLMKKFFHSTLLYIWFCFIATRGGNILQVKV